ncbi:MAG: hypothetical protein JXA79_04440 [Deltaproteobacteria bacterium]|nr:hypothetical protein [Deltaproteobacteria bacterium]
MKRELIEVVVQIFTAHSALMRAQERYFEQSRYPVAGGYHAGTERPVARKP